MMTEYRLHSSDLVHTPGFLIWAILGAQSDHDKMVDIMVRGFDLPTQVASDLLSGKLSYLVDGDMVIFETEEV